MIERPQLELWLKQLPDRRIGLIGDLFLDRYLELIPGICELSIETGLEAYQIQHVRNHPGALGTIVNNLTALGAQNLMPLTVIGQDGHGYDLLISMAPLPVDTDWIIQTESRLTPTYTKPLRPGPSADDPHELNRLDVRSRGEMNDETTATVCRRLRELYRQCDALIVLDQVVELNWGVVNGAVREELHRLAERGDKPIYIDSRAHLSRFRGGMLKGNESEMGQAVPEATSLSDQVTRLASITGQPVFCTLGERGSMVGMPDAACREVPGFAVPPPIDIVGAGDATTSGIILTLLGGGSPLEAALIGNLVASITVQQIGTTGTATPTELLQRLEAFQRLENQESDG